jgi:hypothetical protein
MPPRKKKTKPGSGNNKDEAEKRLEEREAYPHWVEDERQWNFPFFREQLRKHEAKQAEIRKQLPELIKCHTALLEAGVDDVYLQDWYEGEGKNVSRVQRRREKLIWAELQANMEDFLYYQNQANRWQRHDTMEKDEVLRNKDGDRMPPPKKRALYSLLGLTWMNDTRRILDRFDQLETGSIAHRTGLKDGNGKLVKETHMRKLVPPQELRLWTPPTRRAPGGLRITPLEQPNYDPVLDLEAIATRQQEVDSIQNTTEGVQYSNHNDRRQAELMSRDRNQRRHPTSGTFPGVGVDGKVTLNRFGGIQTDQGLFISALESSHDWRTSYDHLDRVKSGIQVDFEVSAVREMIDGPPFEEVADNNKKGKEKVSPPTKRGGRSAAKRGGRGNSAKRAKTGTDDEAGTNELRKIPKVVAEIDYPYESSEFAQIPRRPVFFFDIPGKQSVHVTTGWAEETTGRREWHVHMGHSPPSSVNSPPHSPILAETIDTSTIPTPNNIDISLEHRSRRCSYNPERCRAWWKHDPDECWIVESTLKPTYDPNDIPTEIPPPKDFGLPPRGVRIYDERLPDHYGMLGSDSATWPKLGIRVPYEPMTHDDLKLNPETGAEAVGIQGVKNFGERRGFIANDARYRVPFEVHSMAVPIITEPQSKNGWGAVDTEMLQIMNNNEPSEGEAAGSSDNESELDDEDDMDVFHMAYMEGIAAAPAPPPPMEGSDNNSEEN